MGAIGDRTDMTCLSRKKKVSSACGDGRERTAPRDHATWRRRGVVDLLAQLQLHVVCSQAGLERSHALPCAAQLSRRRLNHAAARVGTSSSAEGVHVGRKDRPQLHLRPQ